MIRSQSSEQLIHRLAGDLTPIRRLRPPVVRLLGWTALLVLLVTLLLWRFGDQLMLRRWDAAPDLVWAAAGAVGTALTAAWACFNLGVPGRSPRWVWAPLPFAVLWIGASGWGCLRLWVAPGTTVGTMSETTHCLVFILAFSLPLSTLLIWLLRRACILRPARAALMVGLASAAASASLLQIFHEFDAAATDLAVHALAIALVIGVNMLFRGRLLSRSR